MSRHFANAPSRTKAERKCLTGFLFRLATPRTRNIHWSCGSTGAQGADRTMKRRYPMETKKAHMSGPLPKIRDISGFRARAAVRAERETGRTLKCNESGRAVTVGFGHSGARRKGLFHRSRSRISRRAIHGRAGVWALLQKFPEQWAARLSWLLTIISPTYARLPACLYGFFKGTQTPLCRWISYVKWSKS